MPNAFTGGHSINFRLVSISYFVKSFRGQFRQRIPSWVDPIRVAIPLPLDIVSVKITAEVITHDIFRRCPTVRCN